MAIKAFGFSFEDEKSTDSIRSFVPEQTNNSINAVSVDSFGTPIAYALDLDSNTESENKLIDKYREISGFPEVDKAIEEIISDMIVSNGEVPIKIDLSELEGVSDSIKEKIEEGFDHITECLNFKTNPHSIVRRWYIDGRIRYHLVVDEQRPKNGIVQIRFIDPRKIKKIREIRVENNQRIKGIHSDILNRKFAEYYIYNEMGVDNINAGKNTNNSGVSEDIPIAVDSIAAVDSGITDMKTGYSLSYLHKALRTANNLRMMEDSLIIYRLARAPERRIFYIDVGGVAKGKSDQYVKQIMNKYKSKLVYDAKTGELKDDRRHLAMTEDYWIPRRDGSRGTEIDTLPGGENLGVIEDVQYFKTKLYESLNVPISRFSAEPTMFSRGAEITRDEVKFSRFISRLRSKFSELFDDILGKHLILTNVLNKTYWKKIRGKINYKFSEDNRFAEALEMDTLQQRFGLLNDAQANMGNFFSREYIMKNILRLTDEEIREMDKQIEKEKKEGKYDQLGDSSDSTGFGSTSASSESPDKKDKQDE